MLFNILAEDGASNKWSSYILIILVVVLLVGFFVWSAISNKKKQKQFNDTINAIKPGNKVKTIGGICGTVVSMNDEENTFVLKTGEEGGEVCYIKFDKQAIYQTDAKATPAEAKKEEPEAEEAGAESDEEVFEELPAEEAQEEKNEEKNEDGEEK